MKKIDNEQRQISDAIRELERKGIAYVTKWSIKEAVIQYIESIEVHDEGGEIYLLRLDKQERIG